MDWLTVKDAAKLVSYHEVTVRELIRAGAIRAEKFGPVWKVDRNSLLRFVQGRQRDGKKRGPKPKH